MKDLLAQCSWPKLTDKYDIALRAAVKFIIEGYTVSGIIASGTIIRGTPDPASDLDIYVIHQQPFRQRLQKFFNQVPAEIFVNPPSAVERYFVEEQASRRPLTAHMLATGFVILNLDPVIDELRQKAVGLLTRPPAAPDDLTMPRYLAALLLEDAADVVERDPQTAEMIVYWAVREMLHFPFIQAGMFFPRQKSLLDEITRLDPQTGELARNFYQAASLAQKMELAGEIADRTIGARSFFEWDKPPQNISNSDGE
jgi:hypothetical protein